MNKTKYNCVHTVPAPCVPYTGKLPEWSKLGKDNECVMISDVLEEIYDEITRIREAIDVRDLGDRCVKVNGDKTVAKIIYAMEDKLCNG